MSKKLLIYGLAFGSASAALSYIYLTSAVYKQSGWIQLFSILSEFLLIPGIAIYLFLKAYKNENKEEFTMGKAVFMGFFLSIIISAAVSLIYSYIHQFKPEYVAQVIDYKTNAYANGKAALSIKDTSVTAYQKDVAAFTKYHREEVYTMRSQFISNLFSGASRGLFLSALFAYLMRAKTVKRD
jgi:tetrahydromethanopterin S-methyltransferase subunit B